MHYVRQLAIQSIGLDYDETLISPRLEEVIANSLGDVDFASLHLILNHSKLKNLLQPELLLGHFQIPSTKQVYKILERSIQWTNDVLNWLVVEKIKPHDLSFLILLSQDENKKLLECAAQSVLTKVDSLNLLEMASELLLMKIDISAVLQSSWTEATILEVKNLRYPICNDWIKKIIPPIA